MAKGCLDSKLLYNAETWAKLKTTHMTKLETVQNNFYKRLIGIPRGTPNAAISEELGIMPVEYKIQLKKTHGIRILTTQNERQNITQEVNDICSTAWIK